MRGHLRGTKIDIVVVQPHETPTDSLTGVVPNYQWINQVYMYRPFGPSIVAFALRIQRVYNSKGRDLITFPLWSLNDEGSWLPWSIGHGLCGSVPRHSLSYLRSSLLAKPTPKMLNTRVEFGWQWVSSDNAWLAFVASVHK